MRGSLSSLPQGWGGRREFTQDPSDSRVGARLDPQMAESLKHWGGLSRAGDGGAELFFFVWWQRGASETGNVPTS